MRHDRAVIEARIIAHTALAFECGPGMFSRNGKHSKKCDKLQAAVLQFGVTCRANGFGYAVKARKRRDDEAREAVMGEYPVWDDGGASPRRGT